MTYKQCSVQVKTFVQGPLNGGGFKRGGGGLPDLSAPPPRRSEICVNFPFFTPFSCGHKLTEGL